MASNKNVDNPFVPARKKQLPLKMALYGPSGSGKTYTALLIAEALAGDDKIAVIDTEGRSSELYADRFKFDVLDLSLKGFDPQHYINAIYAAEVFEYSVIIIDSLTHAWNGSGGILEIVDRAAEQNFGGNKWSGWSKGRPAQNNLVQALHNARIHIIGLMRSKTDWVQETDSRGKTKPVKIGSAPIQDGDIEYEFSIAGLLSMDHNITWSKSRCSSVVEGTVTNAQEGSQELAVTVQQIKSWLGDGAPPENLKIIWTESDAKSFVAKWQAEGYTVDQMLQILAVEKFSDWTGGRAKADQEMIRFSSNMKPAQPKTEQPNLKIAQPEPQPEAPGTPEQPPRPRARQRDDNPPPPTITGPAEAEVDRGRYNPKIKAFEFLVGQKPVRVYGNDSVKKMVGDDYFATNLAPLIDLKSVKFEEVETLRLSQIEWKEGYAVAKKADPVFTGEPEPQPAGQGDHPENLDDWFPRDDEPVPAGAYADYPPPPPDVGDIAF